jgi:amino acid transporter
VSRFLKRALAVVLVGLAAALAEVLAGVVFGHRAFAVVTLIVGGLCFVVAIGATGVRPSRWPTREWGIGQDSQCTDERRSVQEPPSAASMRVSMYAALVGISSIVVLVVMWPHFR